MKSIFKLSIFFLLIFSFLFAQESDCGNGLDDDGDTLVDCADPDCNFQPLPNLPPTATNAFQSGTLPVGANDLHWEISTTGVNGVYSPAIVMIKPAGFITSPWYNTAWISDQLDGNHVARGNAIDYYQCEFYLPCTDQWGNAVNAGTVCLQLTAYVDNSIQEVYLNNQAQSSSIISVPHPSNPYYYCGFCPDSGYSFLFCNGLLAGKNTLKIGVASAPSAIGVLAFPGLLSSPLALPGELQICGNSDQKGVVNLNGLATSLEGGIIGQWERSKEGENWLIIDSISFPQAGGEVALQDRPDQAGTYFYRIRLPLSETQDLVSAVKQVQFSPLFPLSIHPNPSNGKLYIESGGRSLQSVKFYELSGREISMRILWNEQGVEVETDHRGIVLVKILTENTAVVRKVIFE